MSASWRQVTREVRIVFLGASHGPLAVPHLGKCTALARKQMLLLTAIVTAAHHVGQAVAVQVCVSRAALLLLRLLWV